MKRVFLVMAMMAAISSTSLTAAETSVGGELFAHWSLNKTDGSDNDNDFGLGRSYLTAKSKLSDQTSARITVDLRETVDEDGNTRYDMIVKYGYFDWAPAFADGRVTFRFGMQPTMYIEIQNNLWGRRYIEKVPSDRYKYLSSADLGASIHVGLGKDGSLATLTAGVYNGTSYSDISEENKHKDLSFVGVITPLHENPDFKRTTIVGQYYHGVLNMPVVDPATGSDYKRDIVSVGGLLGYREIVDIGADLNWYTEGQGTTVDDVKSSAIGIHGTLYLGELAESAPILRTLDLFGRADLVDPNTDADNDGSTMMILGVECAPVKGFKASVNYQSTSYDEDGVESDKFINFNSLIKF